MSTVNFRNTRIHEGFLVASDNCTAGQRPASTVKVGSARLLNIQVEVLKENVVIGLFASVAAVGGGLIVCYTTVSSGISEC